MKLKLNKNFLLILSLVMLLVFMTACSGGNQTSSTNDNKDKGTETQSKDIKKNISIGTTPVGASINSVGNGIASVVSKNSDVRLTVKPFNGISGWGPSLDKGDIDLGSATAPELAWAFKGEQGFNAMKNIRLLVRGNYIPVTGFVVREDSGINSNADLKGKRISSDYPGSASAVMLLEAVLAANGLSWDDVKKVPTTSLAAGFESLQNNRLDATYAMAPSTPIAQEVNNSVPLKSFSIIDGVKPSDIDSVPDETIEEFTSRVPGTRLTVVKPSGYIKEDTVGVEYPLQIVSSAHLTDDTVYLLLETLWAHYEELHPVHAWLQTWTPEQMFDPNPTVPYHPGAVKFFKDKGLWTDETDKIQAELIKLAE
jgi:uncharacterized protein